jgi:hypothetical protein
MRVIVCGSRTFGVRDAHLAEMDRLLSELPPDVVIVHGDAYGADKLAGKWAALHGRKVEAYPADWTRHGLAAGPLRNSEMLADGADQVIAFWDGASRGTKDMINKARAAGVPTRVHQFSVGR